MSKRIDKEFLLDIQEAIRRIELYTKGLKYEDFLQRIETQDAVLRNLEIIGEAVKNLSLNLKKKYQDIPWKDIAGFHFLRFLTADCRNNRGNFFMGYLNSVFNNSP